MSNRYALITGASRGLGAALAARFWQAGYSLLLVSRQAPPALPVRQGQTMAHFPADLSDPVAIPELVTRIQAHTPQLDVLINNAATQGPIGRLADNDWSEWENTLRVNLLAPVALCRALLPIMPQGSAIIHLSGGGATGPRANFTAYASAKAGLVRFSETLAEEVKPLGIRVNCIAPGAMQTAMLAEVAQKGAQAGAREWEIARKITAQGGADMQRVADLALFLASDTSDGITGKLISAVWDKWEDWPQHKDALATSDAYTLRRITGRDRGFDWGDT